MKRILTWIIVILMVVAGAVAANAATKTKKKVVPHKKAAVVTKSQENIIKPNIPPPTTTKTKAPITIAAPETKADITETPVTDTVAHVAEVPPKDTSVPNIGYDGGFFIKNSDDSFKFLVNGRLQPFVYYQKLQSAPANWSFAIRRARLDFTTFIDKKVTASVSINYGTKSALYSSINLYNAEIDYEFGPWMTAIVGTVGLPLGFKAKSSQLLMSDFGGVPVVTTRDDGGTPITPLRSSFGSPDGIGLELAGDISKFFYDFAVVNGATQAKFQQCVPAGCPAGAVVIQPASGGVESNYDLNFNKKVSTGMRIGMNVLDAVGKAEMDLPYSDKPKLTFSLGGDYQGARTDPYTNAQVKRILTGAASGAFRWRGFSINAETFGRRTTFDSLGTALYTNLMVDDFGYYVNAGYFIVPNKFEVAGLISQIYRQGPHNNSYQFGGGLNYYIKGNNAKVQLDYSLTSAFDDITQDAPSKTHVLLLMFATSF